jgi:TPR repeat protein
LIQNTDDSDSIIARSQCSKEFCNTIGHEPTSLVQRCSPKGREILVRGFFKSYTPACIIARIAACVRFTARNLCKIDLMCTFTVASAEAVKWYRLAADQGYALAQANLGLMYAGPSNRPDTDT